MPNDVRSNRQGVDLMLVDTIIEQRMGFVSAGPTHGMSESNFAGAGATSPY
jgi:hypothetical protein